MPDELLDTAVLPIGADSPWARGYAVSLRPGHAAVVMRGRALGGSGAVNGAYFMRAAPADFDAWPRGVVVPRGARRLSSQRTRP